MGGNGHHRRQIPDPHTPNAHRRPPARGCVVNKIVLSRPAGQSNAPMWPPEMIAAQERLHIAVRCHRDATTALWTAKRELDDANDAYSAALKTQKEMAA